MSRIGFNCYIKVKVGDFMKIGFKFYIDFYIFSNWLGGNGNFLIEDALERGNIGMEVEGEGVEGIGQSLGGGKGIVFLLLFIIIVYFNLIIYNRELY
jgi:hypothetical protein